MSQVKVSHKNSLPKFLARFLVRLPIFNLHTLVIAYQLDVCIGSDKFAAASQMVNSASYLLRCAHCVLTHVQVCLLSHYLLRFNGVKLWLTSQHQRQWLSIYCAYIVLFSLKFYATVSAVSVCKWFCSDVWQTQQVSGRMNLSTSAALVIIKLWNSFLLP